MSPGNIIVIVYNIISSKAISLLEDNTDSCSRSYKRIKIWLTPFVPQSEGLTFI